MKMKKDGLLVLILFMLCVFTTHIASAQAITFGDNVKFGLKVGFNRSSINDEARVQDSGVTPRPGFHAGGLAHVHLKGNWALQTELMYSKEGANYEKTGYTGKTDLNSVNLPILIQYMVGPGFRIQTGPQFGLFTSANYENTDNEEQRKTDIQKWNVSWSAGLGYLTNFGLGFDARFNLGLSNIYLSGAYPGQTARTRAGQFGLFYQFK